MSPKPAKDSPEKPVHVHRSTRKLESQNSILTIEQNEITSDKTGQPVVKTKTVSQTFVTYGGADKGRKFDEKERNQKLGQQEIDRMVEEEMKILANMELQESDEN